MSRREHQRRRKMSMTRGVLTLGNGRSHRPMTFPGRGFHDLRSRSLWWADIRSLYGRPSYHAFVNNLYFTNDVLHPSATYQGIALARTSALYALAFGISRARVSAPRQFQWCQCQWSLCFSGSNSVSPLAAPNRRGTVRVDLYSTLRGPNPWNILAFIYSLVPPVICNLSFPHFPVETFPTSLWKLSAV